MSKENINEPLMSVEEWYMKIKKRNKGFTTYEWMQRYANYHTKWHLNNVKEVVCDESKVIQCNNDKGCGIPYCDQLCQQVDKQSITNAFDNYITNNLK